VFWRIGCKLTTWPSRNRRLKLDGPSMRKIKASEATEQMAAPIAADGKPSEGARK
jgi:hypothetical protein